MSLGALAFLADAYEVSVNFREVRLSETYETASHLVLHPEAEFLLICREEIVADAVRSQTGVWICNDSVQGHLMLVASCQPLMCVCRRVRAATNSERNFC
jgi:hypothetical protein